MKKGAYANSWKSLFNNLVLFLPDIGYSIISVIALFIFGYLSGVIPFLTSYSGSENLPELFADFFSGNILKVIISLAGFIIVTFFIGVGRDALKYSMMRDVVGSKSVGIKKAWMEKKRYYLRIVWLKIKLFAIYVAVSLIFGLLIAFTAIDSNGDFRPGLMILLLALLLLATVILHLILMFRYAIMFSHDYNSTRTIVESFMLFKKKLRKFIIAWLVLLGTMLVIGGVILPLNFVASLGFFINAIIGIFVSVWIDLYLFYSYKD